MDGTVYFGSTDGRLYAVTANGDADWSYPVGGEVNSAPALASDETVYFGSSVGGLYAVQAVVGSASGRLLWKYPTSAGVFSSPAVAVDGTIYVGSLDGKLHAVRPEDGKERWPPFVTSGAIYSSPVVGSDGTIYIGSTDRKLYALQPADGKERRLPFTTGGEIHSSPAIGPNNTIYVASLDGKLYAINPDGTKRWDFSANATIYSSPIVGPDRTIYFAAHNGNVFALEPNEGKELWHVQATQTEINYSSIALTADGTLYVGSQAGLLHGRIFERGLNWTATAIGDVSRSSPVIGADGRIYIGSLNHNLYAINGSPAAVGPWPMFRRDARHTASGFVERSFSLPFYVSGLGLEVSFTVTPPPGVTFYKIEDTPPSGWTVGNVSDNGLYSAGEVRFGPFFDNRPRRLSYQVTPPLSASGSQTFDGISFANGSDRLLGGQHTLNQVPLHPADAPQVDGWMTIGEVTSYLARWRRGSGISDANLERAIELWLNGEAYWYDPAVPTAPLCWTSVDNPPSGVPAPGPLPSGTVAPNGRAIASMPLVFPPATKLTVTIAVTPYSTVTAHAVEDQPPAGWTVGAISDGGLFVRGKVKWGPFADALPRTLSYEVTPPADATNLARFNGIAAFDGEQGAIGGQRILGASTNSDVFAVHRQLPRGYSPGRTMTVTNVVTPLADVDFVIVQDTVPTGWQVDPLSVSDRGVYSAGDNTVRYGVYLDDGSPPMLTYKVTPPLIESRTVNFHGVALSDEVRIVFDDELALSPLHPGDANLIDGWITIGELTSYGAAWKRGDVWGVPQPPRPIQPEYLIRGIELWFGGEHYDLDLSITNAPPYWWVNLTNAVAPDEIPIAIQPSSTALNGTADASLPASFQPGVPITVTIISKPATLVVNYAVEDHPPEGWMVLTNSISYGGFVDALRGKVKWGPFFENKPRTNSYQVIPPLDAALVGRFVGGAAFDGQTLDFGLRQTTRSGNPPPLFGTVRVLPGGVDLTLQGGGAGSYTLQYSTDLIDWNVITNIPSSGGSVSFTDASATNRIRSFYRLLWQ